MIAQLEMKRDTYVGSYWSITAVRDAAEHKGDHLPIRLSSQVTQSSLHPLEFCFWSLPPSEFHGRVPLSSASHSSHMMLACVAQTGDIRDERCVVEVL